MKYLDLPAHLIKFWYLESLIAFIRTWKNTISLLEEDLAVGLMLKLAFVPLFHDSTIVGRILSFVFRSTRILIGLFTFIFISILLVALALFWFLLPVLAVLILGDIGIVLKVLLFSGIVLFIQHIVSHPHKKLWQIKKASEIWECSFVKPKDLKLEKLLKTDQVKNLLSLLELTPEKLGGFISNEPVEEVLQKVWDICKEQVVKHPGPEHFFVGLLFSDPDIDNKLLRFQLKQEDFINALNFLKKRRELWRTVFIWDEDFAVKHLKGTNRGWLGIPTPTLDSASVDLTRLAAKEYVPDFVGRAEVVAKVINILSMEKGTNVVIMGEPGSGRGALVSYLAKRIISGDAPLSLATKRLVRLEGAKLLAGTKTQGDLAQRVKDIFEEVEFSGNIILYIDEIQNLDNLYSLMLPYLESSKTQFIAVTEASSFSRILEKNQSFARLFAKVELPPATISDTIEILQTRAIDNQRYKKIKTSIIAMKKLAELSSEHIHNLVLPDSALQIYEECLAQAKDGWVTGSLVEEIIQSRVSIPVGEAGAEEKKELLNLEERIHQKMIDQQEAVTVVCSTLRRAGAQLREKNRPIGSFLFVGPTGVGKTELAKVLSQVFFEGKGHFARFDMSEYQTAESINRLIGAPGEDGDLTETVRQHPFSLILLDEFEKADPKVLMLFLQILDDGRLTSGAGKLADFTDSIIIATSNAASLTIAKGLEQGQTLQSLEKQVKDELLQTFKPELINRFDGVVLFKTLSTEDLQKIVLLKLKDLQDLLKEQGFLVNFSEGLIKKLAEKGFDPVLGARPLRRLIQDTLEARLSTMILEDKLPKGEKFIAGEELLQ